MRHIRNDKTFRLQIIATNMHLSPEFGLTYKEIESDGFIIDKKVQMLLSSDSSNATTKSVGLAIIGFADAYDELRPDLILVLGDRFEILAAVTAALFYKIPVAHLHGGELTEGAYDDSMRHAITKMSHLHFTSTEEYRKRVIQMGENPDRVYNVGSIGLDNILQTQFLSRKELEESIGFEIGNKCALITFHPVTLENSTAEEQMNQLLEALESIRDLRIIFTLPNSDTDGRVIIKMIRSFITKNAERSVAYPNLGQTRYFSLLKYISAVVGNSSSGIIEAPYFGVPTLNIGIRQKGRLRADSVVDCDPDFNQIRQNLLKLLSGERKKEGEIMNPYHKENSNLEIIRILQNTSFESLIKKRFFDLR